MSIDKCDSDSYSYSRAGAAYARSSGFGSRRSSQFLWQKLTSNQATMASDTFESNCKVSKVVLSWQLQSWRQEPCI